MKKNLKKTLAISGATLMTAMSLGVGVTTAHAASYDQMNTSWHQKFSGEFLKGDSRATAMLDSNGNLLNLHDALAKNSSEAQDFVQNYDYYVRDQSANDTQSTNAAEGMASTQTTAATQRTTPATNVQNHSSQQVASNNSASTSIPASSDNTTYVATKNNSGMKTLPQTGNESGATTTILGLSLTTIASMFGLANLKRHFA